jgi:hypothetical protein
MKARQSKHDTNAPVTRHQRAAPHVAKHGKQMGVPNWDAPHKSGKRGVRPLAGERYYDDDELEFLKAMEAYKKKYDVRFPTLCEILHVAKELGYHK